VACTALQQEVACKAVNLFLPAGLAACSLLSTPCERGRKPRCCKVQIVSLVVVVIFAVVLGSLAVCCCRAL
jgi:hypothetical protein